MRAALLILCAVAVAALAVFWLGGGMDRLTLWAAQNQREFQNAMAGALRRLRAGDAAAWGSLMTVCFAYGFFHAVGPGHGKVLIGGYGVARRVAALRLSAIALVSSLAQGATAVALVGAGIAVFGWGSKQLSGAAEDWFAPVSYGAIALVGCWLVWRGLRHLWAARRDIDHAHVGPDDHCHHCGHKHGPTAEEAQAVSGWRDLVMLVGTIAIRPCTGALFLLLITWRLGVFGAGVAGTFAMALGTASVTIVVALAAVGLRESALVGAGDSRAVRVVVPVLELIAGGVVVLVAGGLLMRALA